MNFKDFVEHMRQEVREEGFIPAARLALRVILRLKERELLGKIDADKVLSEIECDDIHVVKYTNTIALSYNRIKDLSYYNPQKG